MRKAPSHQFCSCSVRLLEVSLSALDDTLKQNEAQAHKYDYPVAHRVLEICAIAGLPVLLAFMVAKASQGLDFTGLSLIASWMTVVILGYLASDFISGFVHFLGDTYGDENAKFFGPSFIKPFRVHHTDPQEICRHDFIELNGNNCLVCIPVGVFAYWIVPAATSQWAALVLLVIASMLFWVFMTNQFHKWAHDTQPPRVVAVLQRVGLVLSPQHHAIHHRAPYDRYYCITVGWMNPLLLRLRFFEGVKRSVTWVTWAISPSKTLSE
jgi:plasmanylethanolamine desaturase